MKPPERSMKPLASANILSPTRSKAGPKEDITAPPDLSERTRRGYWRAVITSA